MRTFVRLCQFSALVLTLTVSALTAGPSAAETDSLPGVRLEGQFIQGALIRGMVPPGSTLQMDETLLPVSADGRFVLGLHRDHEAPVTLTFTDPAGAVHSATFPVEARTYDIQHIDGLPPKMVTPDEATLERIKAEVAEKKAARPFQTPMTGYAAPFIWPAKGRISGVYGSQRVLNGEPRRPHFGIDIAAPKGTPVVAPAPGTVTLADPDMYFEGGLIFIDHGHGVISVLMHLDTLAVEPGQQVAQGDMVGTVGATGRATGPHLDWRMYWRDARVDPSLLVPPMD